MRKADTVLVTGGAGFIGSALSTYLVDNFSSVIAVDNLLPQVHPTGEPAFGFNSGVDLVIGDITEPTLWDTLLSKVKPSLIIHLAAETGTGQSLKESTRHTMVNIVGTSMMLDKLYQHGAIPERILLCSSRAVYGEGAWTNKSSNGADKVFYPRMRTRQMLENKQWDFPNALPLPMNAQKVKVSPESVYGVTKLAQENLLTLWADAFSVDLSILRLQNVYGVGQTPENPYTGIMSLFTKLARAGKTIPLFEDGQVRRDFIYIDDVIAACIAALENKEKLPSPIDIGSGSYTTIQEAGEIIAQIYGAPLPQVTGEYRHGDVRHAWADPALAQKYLDFQAKVTFTEGIKQLARWMDSLAESNGVGK
ncbi:NAD(P)-dependent oxidoreductase [uncultured Arcanobacterium sp.]|uniref:NAD-dependent epimerase/dehydratase family protein n=1 Tax=uncultured Arcanobacterium sp. TaxID=487520 RepID=UPI002624AC24|nr:NAD(P)-dependent oxidoreductase [uncultured Arcanobacterium sp.]